MITKYTISRITEAARIEEVVGEFVSLKKRGSSLLGLCPFHNEKTPSFNVSVSRNIYKCFGCGKAGNAINFMMEAQQMTYVEALKYLAKKYNIEIEEEQVSEEQKKEEEIRHSMQESIHIVNQFAQRFFTEYMLENEEGRIGLAYFRERGFTKSTIEKFQLGFSPEQGTLLTETALQNGYQLDILKKAGLTSSKEDSKYDFFRNRAMFPIHNLMGKVIAFGGRILKKDEKAPKYVNTPESDVYVKSKIVYGIFHAKNEIRKKDECLLVEGYTDVISLAQNGLENVVASSGTALTHEQIKLIKRFTNNITLLYDGDKAGIKAALRGTDLILEEGMNVRIVILPDEEDPDSYMRKMGVTEFEAYLQQNKKDLILFKSSLYAEEVKNDPIKKAEVIRDIVESIAKTPDPIKRSVYLKSCADILNISEQILIQEANKSRRKIVAQYNKEEAPLPEQTQNTDNQTARPIHSDTIEPTVNSMEYYERDIVRILMESGDKEIKHGEDLITVAAFIFEELSEEEFESKYKEVYEVIKAAPAPLSANEYLHHTDPAIAACAMEILTSPHELSEGWATKHHIPVPTKETIIDKDLHSAINRFKAYKNQVEIKKVMAEMEQTTDSDYANKLLKLLVMLNEQKKEFGKESSTVIYRPEIKQP
jgi:DNA primase